MRHVLWTWTAAWLALVALAGPALAQPLRIQIGGADFRPYPVAVPALAAARANDARLVALTRELTALLQGDLDLARSLALVPPKTYLNPEREPETPVFINWVNVGASGLVRGSVDADLRSVQVRLRFYDVATQRELLSKSCAVDLEQASVCVHRFLDALVELLTGEPGIFSSRIAFVRRMGKSKKIFVCDLDGGHPALVTANESLNLLPGWDRSGSSLLYTSFVGGNSDLYRMVLADKVAARISARPGLNVGAHVSPDGRRLALTLSHDGNTEIYTSDLYGQNLVRLTQSFGQDVSPTWSPDGSRIAFVSSRSGQPHIYVMRADGSQQRRLTFRGTYNQEPDWSPRADGQIAFTARDEQYKYDLFLVHPDTGAITRLTQDAGHNEGPSFSPDGQHLVFTSTRGPEQTRQLWLIDVDGQNPRRLQLPVGDYENPAWGPRQK